MNVNFIENEEVIKVVKKAANQLEQTGSIQCDALEARIIKEALHYFLNDFCYKM